LNHAFTPTFERQLHPDNGPSCADNLCCVASAARLHTLGYQRIFKCACRRDQQKASTHSALLNGGC
ncbi:hypothetical protein, partial [Burkholderia sp. SIMBA_052]|uniref:hypothetical protein n=1 Tax=Burkholderia sp. SIMBA_052 TaxID=3085793 RepID=UPI00397D2967